MTQLKAIDDALSPYGNEKSKVNTISQFFENNADYIGNDKTAAIRIDSIAAKVRSLTPNNPLITRLQNYVGQLLPSTKKEEVTSSCSVLKENSKNYIQSLADWINLMEIPLSSLTLSGKELGDLIPKLRYVDLCNIDISKYDLSHFKLNLHNRNFKLKTSDKETRFNIAKHYALHDRPNIIQDIKNFEIEDKTHLFEIAKLWAQKSGLGTAEHIKKFGIEDQTHLFEIAKLCALQNGEMAEHIGDFGIKDQKHLIEIAMICIEQDSREAPGFIKNFGIEDKMILFEIAKFCAQKNGLMTAGSIENFEIVDQTHLFEIAKLCALQNGRAIPINIMKFGIKDQSRLYELAKICAEHEGMYTANYIKNFGIEDKTHLFEIAKLCAKQDGGATSKCIENFGIEDEEQLYEIAKLCAQQNAGETATNFRNFKIKNKARSFEIAKLCAQLSGWQTAQFIKYFGIEDKTQLYEIAKLCAQQNGLKTAEYISGFGIEDQEHLYEIAMLCAQQNGHGTAVYIGHFGILSKPHLYELLKMCAQNNGAGRIAYAIKDLQIDDETHLFEIAKLCAKNNGCDTAMRIKNFGFKDQNQLYEIAILCAQQSGKETARYIKNFGLKDEGQLFEIAMLCAQEDGGGTTEFIQNFGFKDKIILYKIATACAKQNAAGTAKYLENFKIEDKSHLFEIAKLCAQRDSYATSLNIDSFEIEGNEKLYEIIKLCARQNGAMTAKYIKRFKIEDQKKRWELFLECFKADNNALHSISCFLPLPEGIRKLPTLLAGLLIQILKSDSDERVNRKAFFTRLKGMIDMLPCSTENKEKLARISEEIAKLDIHIQNETATWFLKCLFLSIQMQRADLNWILESKLWEELARMREPRLRTLLTPGLFEFNKGEVPNGAKGLLLLVIPFYQLQRQTLDQEVEVSRVKFKLISKKLKTLQNKGNTLKNVLNVQTLLHMVHLLANTDALTLQQKIQGIDKIFFKKDGSFEDNPETLLKKINAAKGLLQIKNREWTNSLKDPAEEFNALLESLIPITGVQGVISDHYNNTFAKSRNPYGLITYAAGLKTLNEPTVMKCLGEYVSSVFNGKFKDSRYETTRNPHLKTIAESHPNIIPLWRKDVAKAVFLEGEKKEDFDPKKWIELKLSKDKHFFGKTLPFIEDYYKTNTVEDRELLFKKLNEELEKENDKTAFKTLKLQQACIALAEAQPDNVVRLLTKIQEYILDPQTGFATSEFAADVNGRLERNKTATELKIIFGDDPIDLLLCGTDVSGSCQRIGGNPQLNKGLLGYLMDGKNRLLAIKDGSGKIVARCMLRLLWDGERPVIYRERFYPDDFDSRLKKAMDEAAKEIAKALDVPLTSGDAGTPYGKPLQALGGPAPYEYTDGGGGVQKEGRYTVPLANLIV